MHKRNIESPMKVQGANPKTVQCRDCRFRDRTVLELTSGIINVGAIKSYCGIYTRKNFPEGKPGSILFEIEKCRHYKKETD